MPKYILKRWWNNSPFILALATFLLLGWTIWLILHWPYDGVEQVSHSFAIEILNPAGPSARVLRAGDVIVSVNGRVPDEVKYVYANLHPGDVAHFVVRRDDLPFQADVRLELPPVPYLLRGVSPIIVAIAFWLIGTGVLALDPSGSRSRLFFIMCQVWSSVMALGLLAVLGRAWAIGPFYICLWFFAPLLIHFHMVFPEPHFSRPRQHMLALAYGLAVLGSMPFLLWNEATLRATGWYDVLHLAARFVLVVGMLLGSGLLITSYRAASTNKIRLQIRLVALSGCVALVPFTALSVLPDILWTEPLIPYEMGFLFLLAIPLGYGYAIARHRLLKLDLFLSRGAAVTLGLAFLVMLYLVLSSVFSRLLPGEQPTHPLINTLIVVLMAATFNPLRRRVQNLVDWAFYGGWYNYSTAVEQITNQLEQISEVNLLADVICNRLKTTLRLECAYLFLVDPSGALRLRGEADHERNISATTAPKLIPSTGALTRYLAAASAPIEIAMLRDEFKDAKLLEGETWLLYSCPTQLCVPIASHQTLLGILTLGARRGGEVFDLDDLRIVQLIARQVGSIAQNIQLSLELERHSRELTRLHHEIVGAREEERKRLARELHDDIIQSLIALNFQLTPHNNSQPALLQSEIHQIVDELRELCHELRPTVLDDLGLVPAMRSRLRDLSNSPHSALQVAFKVEGDEEQWIPEEIALCLFRILQEAIANVQKHAQARRLSIQLSLSPAYVRLAIEDDGRGFAVPRRLGQLLADDHFGLVGLRERVELVHGTFEIESVPGRGTVLRTQIPVPLETPAS